jgi:hypothetical protein
MSDEERATVQAWAEASLKLPPEAAAETIVRAVERRQPRLIVGRDAQIASILERLGPVTHLGWLQRLASRKRGRASPA